MLERGDLAASFVLTDLDQKSHSLSNVLKSGPVLLAFFKISCPTCQFTFQFLERLHRAASTGTPRVIAISQDTREATLEFHQEFGITIPTLLDKAAENYPASNGYAIASVPSLFLVETDGTIAWAQEGFHRVELETVAKRFGVALFRAAERVPEARPG